MTEPAPLFDVDQLREVRVPTIGVLHRDEPIVVLGSTQPTTDLDLAALRRDGIALRRRRGGGGAVLLREGDCWIELWRPAPSGATRVDVRATAYEAGGWWQDALTAHGLTSTVHRGDVLEAAQGAVACFAGLGPGELTVDGAKLVGISQWRSREGTLVSSVVGSRSPDDLSPYLASRVPRLTLATSLSRALSGVGVAAIAASFVAAVSATLSELVTSAATFE